MLIAYLIAAEALAGGLDDSASLNPVSALLAPVGKPAAPMPELGIPYFSRSGQHSLEVWTAPGTTRIISGDNSITVNTTLTPLAATDDEIWFLETQGGDINAAFNLRSQTHTGGKPPYFIGGNSRLWSYSFETKQVTNLSEFLRPLIAGEIERIGDIANRRLTYEGHIGDETTIWQSEERLFAMTAGRIESVELPRLDGEYHLEPDTPFYRFPVSPFGQVKGWSLMHVSRESGCIAFSTKGDDDRWSVLWTQYPKLEFEVLRLPFSASQGYVTAAGPDCTLAIQVWNHEVADRETYLVNPITGAEPQHLGDDLLPRPELHLRMMNLGARHLGYARWSGDGPRVLEVRHLFGDGSGVAVNALREEPLFAVDPAELFFFSPSEASVRLEEVFIREALAAGIEIDVIARLIVLDNFGMYQCGAGQGLCFMASEAEHRYGSTLPSGEIRSYLYRDSSLGPPQNFLSRTLYNAFPTGVLDRAAQIRVLDKQSTFSELSSTELRE